MMINISTLEFDPKGTVDGKILLGSKLDERKKRISKTATLDGNVAIVDFGFSESDRELYFNLSLEKIAFDKLERIARIYEQVLISCYKGLFLGHIVSLNTNNDVVILRFYVKENRGILSEKTAFSDFIADFANNRNTLGELTLNEPVWGEIKQSYDSDWYSVFLMGGSSITFTLSGGTLNPVEITGIYNQGEGYANTLVFGADAQIDFLATVTGVYWIAVAAHGSNIGTYRLIATEFVEGV